MTRDIRTTTTSRTVARIRDGDGTAYTAIVETVDPEDHPALEQAGFHSETTLYTITTPGAVYSDYDPHRLAGALPGTARWVTDALRDVEEVHDREIVGAGPDAEPDVDVDVDRARRRLSMLEDVVTSSHDDAIANQSVESLIDSIREDLGGETR